MDAVTSGFGHLLGTGLLNQEETALLAARLTAPDLDAGHGLRTLSSAAVGFNPYGYHIGSIWPHDTAIAVHGLVRAGFADAAAPLAAGLLTASATFDARLPELYAGHGSEAVARPAPYPASCRPRPGRQRHRYRCCAPRWAWRRTSRAARSRWLPDSPAPTALDGDGTPGRRGPLDITLAADGTVSVTGPKGLTVATTDR